MEQKNVLVQNETDSTIWRLGLAGVIIEFAVAVLMYFGVVDAELAGILMAGFAGIMAYVNGNNPNIHGQYNVQPKEPKE